MPPLPTIAGVDRVALNWEGSGASVGLTATNVMHFLDGGHDPAALFAIIDGAVTAAMWGPIADSMSVTNVVITPLDGSSASAEFVTGSPSKWTGPGAGDAIPNMAGVAKFLTPARGRSFRGRAFLGPVSEGSQAHGVIPSTVISAWQAAWNTFLAAMGTAGTLLQVASYKLAVSTQVTAVVTENIAATQRRRQSRLR